jgi:hypothetical protein
MAEAHTLIRQKTKLEIARMRETLSRSEVLILDEGHVLRLSAENHIRHLFRKHYGGVVDTFAQYILGLRDEHGEWLGTVGYSPLTGTTRLVEKYMDNPIDQLMSQKMAVGTLQPTILRRQVAEVSNLTTTIPGGARVLIKSLTQHLFEEEIPWVAFVATPTLINAFHRIKYSPVPLVQADPVRLGEKALNWGTYYRSAPWVMGANSAAAHALMRL